MTSAFRTLFAWLPLFGGLLVGACKAAPDKGDEAGPPVRVTDAYASAAHVCSSTAEDQALALINAARARAGVPAFACLPKLSAMASAHAVFLAAHENLGLASGHSEQEGASGYTGVTLGERARHQGLEVDHFWLSEGVGGGRDAATVVAAHLATVYHRSALLAPGGRYFAFALAEGSDAHPVMNMLLWVTVDQLQPDTWPEDGAVDVPLRFNASGEKPAPVPQASTAGYPISVHFPRYLDARGDEPLVQVDRFELKDTDGAIVSTQLLSHASDAAVFRSDAFLVPEEPLRAATSYVVEAKLAYGVFRVDQSWTFKTASAAP